MGWGASEKYGSELEGGGRWAVGEEKFGAVEVRVGISGLKMG